MTPGHLKLCLMDGIVVKSLICGLTYFDGFTNVGLSIYIYIWIYLFKFAYIYQIYLCRFTDLWIYHDLSRWHMMELWDMGCKKNGRAFLDMLLRS